MRKGKGGKGKGMPLPASGSIDPVDLEFAVNLHTLICSNLPNPTLVESIPSQYLQMYWKPFPIPPEAVPAGPNGLMSVLESHFDHLMGFSKDFQTGEFFVKPKLPPNLSSDDVARFHTDYRLTSISTSSTNISNKPVVHHHPLALMGKNISAPKPLLNQAVPASAPVVKINTIKLTPEEENSAQIIIRCLHKILSGKPYLGEADSMPLLHDALHEAYFELMGLPMVLCSGLVVDPLDLIQKNQGKSFTRIFQEPVTGKVNVRAIQENPQFASIGSVTLTEKNVSSAKLRIPKELESVASSMRLLKDKLSMNLHAVDSALAQMDKLTVPDVNLWLTALDTLVKQESQAGEILSNLFK